MGAPGACGTLEGGWECHDLVGWRAAPAGWPLARDGSAWGRPAGLFGLAREPLAGLFELARELLVGRRDWARVQRGSAQARLEELYRSVRAPLAGLQGWVPGRCASAAERSALAVAKASGGRVPSAPTGLPASEAASGARSGSGAARTGRKKLPEIARRVALAIGLEFEPGR